jgi:hypothetical protein
MTKEEIIQMANQAGWEMDDSLVLEPEIVWYICQGQLQTFAKLVAEKEREACARISDEWVLAYPHPSKVIAETIRARGKE